MTGESSPNVNDNSFIKLHSRIHDVGHNMKMSSHAYRSRLPRYNYL